MKMNRKFVGILFCIVLGIATFSFLSGVQVGRSEFAGIDTAMPKFNEINFPFEALIDTNGTHYAFGNATTWRWQYINSNASKVLNFARGNLSSLATGAVGTIAVRKGTYQLNADFIIGRKTHLIGLSGVIFNVTANLSEGAIVIDDSSVAYTDWQIQNIQIQMNQFNGDAIHSDLSSQNDSKTKGYIFNLYITNVKVGYAGIDLVNVIYDTFSQIRMTTYGTGIRLRLDDTLISGNSVFSDIIIGTSANNAIGLDIQKSANKYYNLIQFDRFQVGGGSTPYTNNYGLKLDGLRQSQFNNIDLEGNWIGAYLNSTQELDFYASAIWNDDTSNQSVSVFLANSTTRTEFFGGEIVNGAGAWSYCDNSTAGSSSGDENILFGTNVYKDWYIKNSNTKFQKALLWNTATSEIRPSSRLSTATVSNNLWITHNLCSTPTQIDITVKTATYGGVPVIVTWKDQNTTKFQVTVYWANGTAISTASVSISWMGWVNP